METMGLGAFVKERREARGWSQTRLAAECGLDRAYLSQIESGKVGWPGADIRRRLAAALGLRHVDLLIAAGELSAEEASGVPEFRTAGELDRLVEPLDDNDRRIVREVVESIVAGRQRAARERLIAAEPYPQSPAVG